MKDNAKFTKMREVNHQLLDGLKKNSLPFEGESLVELECNIDLSEKKLQIIKQNIDEKLEFEELSSSPDVIQSIDQSLVAEKVKVNLADSLLNVVWDVTSDCFNYVVSSDLSGSVTCRKLLSIVSSGLDSFCLFSPFVLIGKMFMQYLETMTVSKDTLYGNIKVRFKKLVNMWNQIKGKMTSLILTFSGGGMKKVEDGSSDISMELKEMLTFYVLIVMFSIVLMRGQWLNNIFWTPWRLEFLSKHPQWLKRSTSTRDVVLVVDDARPRSRWKMDRLPTINVSEDNHVCSASGNIVASSENKLSSIEPDQPTQTVQLVYPGPIPRQ